MFKKFKRILSASLSAIMILSSGGNLIIPSVYAEPVEEQTQIEEQTQAENKIQLFADDAVKDYEGNDVDNTKAHLYVDVLGVYDLSTWSAYLGPESNTAGAVANRYTRQYPKPLRMALGGVAADSRSEDLADENIMAEVGTKNDDMSMFPSPMTIEPNSNIVKKGDLVYLGVRLSDVENTKNNALNASTGHAGQIYDAFSLPIHTLQVGMYYDSRYVTPIHEGLPYSNWLHLTQGMISSKLIAANQENSNDEAVTRAAVKAGTNDIVPIKFLDYTTVKNTTWYPNSILSDYASSKELWGRTYQLDSTASTFTGKDDSFGSIDTQTVPIPDQVDGKPINIGNFGQADESVGFIKLSYVPGSYYNNNDVGTYIVPRKLTENNGENYLTIIPFYVKNDIPENTAVTELVLQKDYFAIVSAELNERMNIGNEDNGDVYWPDLPQNLGSDVYQLDSLGDGDGGNAVKWFDKTEESNYLNMKNYVQFMGDPILNPTADDDTPTPAPANPILTVTGDNVTIEQNGTPITGTESAGKTTYELETGKTYTATVTSFDDGKKFGSWNIGESGEDGASNIAPESGNTAASNPLNFKISGDETLAYETADKTQPTVYIGSEGTTTASYNRQTDTSGVVVTIDSGDYTYSDVKYDGSSVATTNYSYNATDNTVTFSDAYLKSLSIDTDHEFTFEFTGDSAVENPTVTITVTDTSTYLNQVQINTSPTKGSATDAYIHGNKLDLTGLEFTVKRGQEGHVESTKQFKYDGSAWVSDSPYAGDPYDDVTITLNDGGTGTEITSGNEKDQITVRRDNHNGKKITVTPINKSTATTVDSNPGFSLFSAEKYAIKSDDTAALTVNQKTLPVTASVTSEVSQEYAGTVTGNVAFNDANKAKVTVTPDSDEIVDDDEVTASASAPAFKGFHAGTYTGDTGIDLGTVSLGGTHAGNYTLGEITNNVSGKITAKTVTVTVGSVPSKVAGTVTKDGSYALTPAPTVSGIYAADNGKVSVVGTGASDAWVYSYVENSSHNALSADPVAGNYTAKVGAKLSVTDNDYQNDYVLKDAGVYFSADGAAVVTARTIKNITATAQSKTFTHGETIITTAGVKDAAFKVTWSDDSYTTYKYGDSGWEIDTTDSNYTATSFADSGVTVGWKKGTADISGTPNAEYGSTYSYNATATIDGTGKTVALTNYTVNKKDIYVKLAKADDDTDLNKEYDGDNKVADGKVVAKVYSDSSYETELSGVTVILSDVHYVKTGSEPADKDAGTGKKITATASAPNSYNIANTIDPLTGAEITQKAITITSVTDVPSANQNTSATAPEEKKPGSGSVAGVNGETVYYEYEVTYTTTALNGAVGSTPSLDVTNGENGYKAVGTPAGKPTNTGYVPANYTLTGPSPVTGLIANPGVGTPKSLAITTLPTLAKTYGDNGVNLKDMVVTITLYGESGADGATEVYTHDGNTWKKGSDSVADAAVPFTVELVKEDLANKNVTDVVTLYHAGYAVKATHKDYTSLTDKKGSITVSKKALTLNITYSDVKKTYDGTGTIGTVADILGTGITGSATFAQDGETGTLTASDGKVTLKGAELTPGNNEGVVVDLSKITAAVTAGSGTNNYEKFGAGSKGITTTTADGYYNLTDEYDVTVISTGNITIEKMALTVKSITGIPSIELGANITSKVENQNAKLKDTAGTATAEIEVNETPVSGENLTFTYSYKYSKNTPKGDDEAVAITDVAMASTTGVNANYTISGDVTATGTITGKAINTLTATKTTTAYVHGETLGDLSDLTITANGTDYTLSQWTAMGGTVTLAGVTNADGAAAPAADTVMRYDNSAATGGTGGTPKNLTLTVTAPSEITTLSLFANMTATVTLTVSRRPVSVSAALADADQKVTKEFNNDLVVPSSELSRIKYTLGTVIGENESGVIDGDTVSLTATPTYTNKDFGIGNKTLKFSDTSLSGENASCYSINGSLANLTNAGTINKRKVKLNVTLPTTVYEGDAKVYNNIGKDAAANGSKWTAVHLNSDGEEDTADAFYGTDGDDYKVTATYAETDTAGEKAMTYAVASQLNTNYIVTAGGPDTGTVTANTFTISVESPKTAELQHGDVIDEKYNADTQVKLTWTNGKVTIYTYSASGGWELDETASSYDLSYENAQSNKGLSIAFRAADSVTPGTTKADYGKADKTYKVQASATDVTAVDVLTYTVKQREVYVKASKKTPSTQITKTYDGNATYDNTPGNITLSLTTDSAGNNSYNDATVTVTGATIKFVKTGDGYTFADKDAGSKKMQVSDATLSDGNHKIMGYICNIEGKILQKEITVTPTILSVPKDTKATADVVKSGSGTYTDSVTSETVSYTFDATYPLSYVKSGTTPVPNVPISNYAIADATHNNNYIITEPTEGEGSISGVAAGSVTGISITNMPSKAGYEYGDALVLDGMEITATIAGDTEGSTTTEVYTYGDDKWTKANGDEVTGIEVKIKKGAANETAIPDQLKLTNSDSNMWASYDGFNATSEGKITVGKKKITLTINYPDGMEKLYNKDADFKTVNSITGTTFDVNGTPATANASGVIEITGAFTGEKINVNTASITAKTTSADAGDTVSLADPTVGTSAITYASGASKDNYEVTIAQNDKTVKINPYPITITVGGGAVSAITLGDTQLATDVTGATTSGTGAKKITVAKTNSENPAIPDSGFTVNYTYTYSASGPTTSTSVTVSGSDYTLTAPAPVANYSVTWADNLSGSISAKVADATDFTLTAPTKNEYIHGQNLDLDGLKVAYQDENYIYSTASDSEWVKNGNKLYLVHGDGQEEEITDTNKTMQLRYDGEYAHDESDNKKTITFKVKVPKSITALPPGAAAAASLFNFTADGSYYADTFTVSIAKREIETITSAYKEGVTSIDKEYNNSADADASKAVLTAASADNDTTNVIDGDTVTLKASAKYQDGDTPADTDKNASENAKNIVFSGVSVGTPAEGNNNDCYVVKDGTTVNNLSGKINKRPITIVVNSLPAAYKHTEDYTNVKYDLTDYTPQYTGDDSKDAFMPATDADVYTYEVTYANLSESGQSTSVSYAIKDCTDDTIGNNYEITFDGDNTVTVQAGKINSLSIEAITAGHTHGDGTEKANITVNVSYEDNHETYVYGLQNGDTTTKWYLRTGSENDYTYTAQDVASIFAVTWEGTSDRLTAQLSNRRDGKKLVVKPTDTSITGVTAETGAFAISKAEVTVTLDGSATKVYNKTDNMAMNDGVWNGITATLTGHNLISGEQVKVDNTSDTVITFSSADVHNNAAVTVGTLTLTGTGSDYYIIKESEGVTNNATGSITAKPITVTIGGTAEKTYDSTATVTDKTGLTVTSTGILSGDSVGFDFDISEFEFVDANGAVTANASSEETWATNPAAKIRAKDGDKTKVSLNNSNYSINTITAGGTGMIKPFDITVTGISNIPNVALGGSTDKETGNKATSGETDETYKSQLTITETIPNNETITATYSYQYTDTSSSGTKSPTISDVELETNILKQNYNLETNIGTSTGTVDSEEISDIKIVDSSEHTYTKAYTHGDALTTDDIYILVNEDDTEREYTAAQWLAIGGKLEFAGISENNETLPTGKTVRFDNTSAGAEADGKKPITITATAPADNKLTQLFSMLFDNEKTATATITVERKQLTDITPTKSAEINKEYDGTSAADTANITFALNDSDIVVKTAPSTKDDVSIDSDSVTADYYDGTNKVSGASDTVRSITFGKKDDASTILTGDDADCYIAPVINDLDNAGKITKRRLLLTVDSVPPVSVGTTGASLTKETSFSAAHRSDSLTISGAVADITGITTDEKDAFIGNDKDSFKVKAKYSSATEVNTTGVEVAISIDPATSANYELTVLDNATGKITSFEIKNVELITELKTDNLVHGAALPEVPSDTKLKVTWADELVTVYRYDTSHGTHEWVVEDESGRTEVEFSQAGLTEIIKINSVNGDGDTAAVGSKANYHKNDTDTSTKTYNYLIQYDKKADADADSVTTYLPYAQYDVTQKELTLTMSKNSAADDVINKIYDGDADYKGDIVTDSTIGKIKVGLTGIEQVVTDGTNDDVSIDISQVKLAYEERSARVGLGDKDAGQKNIVFANENIDDILTGDDAACYTITDQTASIAARITAKALTVTSTSEDPIAATVQYKQNAPDTEKETTYTMATDVGEEKITCKFTVKYNAEDISNEDNKDQSIKVSLVSGAYGEQDYEITSNSPKDANNYTLTFGDIYGKITSYVVQKYVVKSMPDTVEYVYGDKVDLTGMTVEEVITDQPSNIYTYGTFNGDTDPGWYLVTGEEGNEDYTSANAPFTVGVHNNGSDKDIDATLEVDDSSSLTLASGEIRVEWTDLTNKIKVGKKTLTLLFKDYPAQIPSKTYDGEVVFGDITDLGVRYYQGDSELTASSNKLYMAGANSEYVTVDLTKLIVTANSKNANAGDTDNIIEGENRYIESISTDKALSDTDTDNYEFVLKYDDGTVQTDDFTDLKLQINKLPVNVTLSDVPKAVVGQEVSKGTGVKANQTGTGEGIKGRITVTKADGAPAIPDADKDNFVMTYDYEYAPSHDASGSSTLGLTISNEAFTDDNDISTNFKLNLTPPTSGEVDPQPVETATAEINKDYIHGENFDLEKYLTATINGMIYGYSTDDESLWKKNGLTVKIVQKVEGSDDTTIELPADDIVRYDASYANAVDGQEYKEVTFHVTFPQGLKAVPPAASSASMMQLFDAPAHADVTVKVYKRPISVTAVLADGVEGPIAREYNSSAIATNGTAEHESRITLTPEEISATEPRGVLEDDTVTFTFTQSKYTETKEGVEKDSLNASEDLKNITVVGIALADKANDNNNDCYTLDNETALIANSGRIDKRNVYIDVTSVPSISVGSTTLTRDLAPNNYTAYHGTSLDDKDNETAFFGEDVEKYKFTIRYDSSSNADKHAAIKINDVVQEDDNYLVKIGGVNEGEVTSYKLIGYVIDYMPDGYDRLVHGDKLPLNGMELHEVIDDDDDPTGSTFKYGKFDENGHSDASAEEGWYEKGKFAETFSKIETVPFDLKLTNGRGLDNGLDNIKKSADNNEQIVVTNKDDTSKTGTSEEKLNVSPKEIKINVIYPENLEKTYNALEIFDTVDNIDGVKLERDFGPEATMSPDATLAPEATAQPIGENVVFDGVNGEKITINLVKLTAKSDTADAGSRTLTTESDDAVSYSDGVDSDDYNVIIEGSGKLTINKMGINIAITNIPNAIVDQAPAKDTVNAHEGTDFTVEPAVNGEKIPAADSGNFALSYTYEYEFNTSTDQEPTITITNPTLSAAYDNNYEIIDCTAKAEGKDKIDPSTTDEEHVSVNKVKKDYIHGETLNLDDLTVEINGLTYEYDSDAWNKNGITVALVNNDDTSEAPAVDGKTLRYDGTYAGTAVADGKKPMTLNVTIQKEVHAVPTAENRVSLFDEDSSIVLPVALTIDKKTITSVTAELINDAASIDKEYDGTPDADKTNIAFIPNAEDIIAGDKAVVTADAKYTVEDTDSKDASENKKDISFVNAVLTAKANDNNNDCYKLADNLVIAKLNESGIIKPREVVVKATLPMTSVATGAADTYTITNYTAEHKDDPTGMAFTEEDKSKFTFTAKYDTSVEAEVPVEYSYAPDDTNYSIEIQGTPSTMKVEDNIPVITNIEVIGETNTDVTNGDEFDLTGITVKVTYSNDTVEEYVFTNPEDETQPAGWYLDGTKAESVPFNTNWNDEDKTPTGTYFPYDKNGNEVVVTPADPTVTGGGNVGPFTVSPKVIDVTLRGNVSKVYDKTSAVTSWDGIDVKFDGVVGNDVVEIDKTTSSLKYINKTTGEDAVDVALADGIDVVAVNLTNAGYIANVIDNTTAQITPATIDFTKITVSSKTKGSSVDVKVTASNKYEATGIYEGDTVTISYSGKFASTSSVAKDVAVTIDQLTIDGDERSVNNYIVGTIPAVTADVTSSGNSSSGGGGSTNSLTIKVINPDGKIVTITKKLTAPALSDPVNLTAVFEKQLKDQTVIWKSEDESIVLVDENGVVSFLKVGETKVTATSKSNPNLKNVVEIVVTEALVKPTPVPTEIPHETVIKSVLNPYIIGYDDNVFGPELPISREEVATIFARLIANSIYMDYDYATKFWDVSDEDWSRDYIGYLETFDIIHGYDDGSFMPKSYITRAEMAVMMARAEGYDIEGYMAADEMAYPDIPEEYGTWATKAIDILTAAGVMQGYEDGTFRPTQPITRAETVATVNRVLKNMEVDVIEVRPSDMTDAHWAYDNVIFAMNHRILKDVAADANTFVWSEEFDKNITTKEEVVIKESNGENISPTDSVIVPQATAQPMAD